ncbi:MAG: SNF2-related protein [Leptospirales bacterium]
MNAKTSNGPGDFSTNIELFKDFTIKGILYSANRPGNWWENPFDFCGNSETVSFLDQLLSEGLAQFSKGGLEVGWENLYRIRSGDEWKDGFSLLGVPSERAFKPFLQNSGTLEDERFQITIRHWITPSGNPLSTNPKFSGPVLQVGQEQFLLPETIWLLKQAVTEFYQRGPERRSPQENRLGFAKIQRLALSANVGMSDFLQKTIVLLPEHLRLKIDRTRFGETNVIEVQPLFDQAPERWIDFFDRYPFVKERYDIPEGTLLVQVVVPPQTKKVLDEIKKWPGRRVSGPRAEAFISNPFALLGESEIPVINEEEFELEKLNAGIFFQRFTHHIDRNASGEVVGVSLNIETVKDTNIPESERYVFPNWEDLDQFLKKVEEKLRLEYRYCNWNGYEFELFGDTSDQVSALQLVLGEWKESKVLIRHTDIHDLSHYSERIIGIGVEKFIYSPFIARKDINSSWFPENVVYGFMYVPQGNDSPVCIQLDPVQSSLLEEKILECREKGSNQLEFQDHILGIEEAENIVSKLTQFHRDVVSGKDVDKLGGFQKNRQLQSLILKPNIEFVDYEEKRRSALQWSPEIKPMTPDSLGVGTRLLEHQEQGLSWLQYMWKNSPGHVRGVVLADDMGLGKTLQILAFMAGCFETSASLEPALVVAPVSLIENWQEEAGKFLKPGIFKTLTLYGRDLKEKKVDAREIESKLKDEGITRFLKPGWVGDANLVLTTYETLRDQEFSFSTIRWSIMVCDEAQKIKNPNALVSRVAKKQNVRFKIACTGTPVENTLVDLWCLFDFIQPGLLGALNQFGKHYQKPIEAKTDEEKKKVEELRALIAPQILRRMKKEVSKSLPNKIIDNSCRSLTLSNYQRELYSHAIHLFKNRKNLGEESKGHHLSLLHYLKILSADPRPYGAISGEDINRQDLSESPKLKWLLETLHHIRSLNEKAIIFVEYRDIQRKLRCHIHREFGFSPGIINGDTPTGTSSDVTRGKMIKMFSESDGFSTIILSPKAVGFGVNIQAANHVIHFMRPWNPATEDQATDRAYRIGQTKDVHVYYPVVCADDFVTFDVKLDKLLERKRALSEDMLNGAGEISPAEFLDLSGPEGERIMDDHTLTSDDLAEMSPDFFECFCSVLWKRRGASDVLQTASRGDGGVDIVAITDRVGDLIQCKSSSKEGSSLGWNAIKDVVAGEAQYRMKFPKISFNRIAVTNQYFNDTARKQAELNDVQLLDRDDLSQLIKEFPIRRFDVEIFRISIGHGTE